MYKPFLCCLMILLVSCKQPKEKSPSVAEHRMKAKLLYKANAQLGEGAFWNYKSQEFFWIDIEGKQVHIFNPETGTNTSFTTPTRVGTVVPQTDSTAVVALEDGIYILNTKTGAISQLSNVEEELTTNRFNDGKCDPNGNLWVGSMQYAQNAPEASVYKIEPSGKTTKMIDSVTISNGIVWTKDAKTMYYIDTPTSTIKAYDYDATTATIRNERVAVKVDPKDGFPDGMAIDREDMLWVGLWNGNAVARYNPITGTLINKVTVPAHNVTACAFGGPHLDQLYITTARVDMTPEELEKYPDAGSLFVAEVGVQGVQSDIFGTAE